MACEGVSDIFNEGDELKLAFENSSVENRTTGKKLQGPPLVDDLINIVKAGGILKVGT
jgi:hypothetical protein